MDCEKTYVFTIAFGEERTTGDSEGEVVATSDYRPTKEEIQNILKQFKGTIVQTPPKFSAIKINGKRAYDLARENKSFEIKPRNVLIKDLFIEHFEPFKSVTLNVVCGKGTYIRSLASDIAEELGTKGYVSYLRRTKVGFFYEKNAILLDKIKTLGHIANIDDFLLSAETVLTDISALAISDTEAQDLKCGKAVVCKNKLFADLNEGDTACAVNNNKLIAIVKKSADKIVPIRVMNY